MKTRITLPIILLSLIVGLGLSCRKDKTEPLPEPIQAFEAHFGGNGDQSLNSVVYKDSFLYAFGTNDGVGGNRYLIKTDLEGNLIFGASPGPGGYFGKEIIATSDGNFLTVGNALNPDLGNDFFMMKFTPNGDVLWANEIGFTGNDNAGTILEADNSDLILVGSAEGFGSGDRDIYVGRFSSEGVFISQNVYGGTGNESASDVVLTSDNELLIFGNAEEAGEINQDYFLLKVNLEGDSLWSKVYGGADYEEANEVFETPQGDIVMCGHSASTDPIHDMYCVKVDSDGDVIWEKNYGGVAHDGGQAALLNSDGDYVFVARSMSFEGTQAAYMVTTDQNGNVMSEEVFNHPGADRIDAIIEVEDAYYLVGQTSSFGDGDFDAYVIRKNLDD